MPFESIAPFRAVDRDRGINILISQDYRCPVFLDETKNRQCWGFIYEFKEISIFGRYYISNIRYDFERSDGSAFETGCTNLVAIPKNIVIDLYKLKFLSAFRAPPSQSEIDRFLTDIQEAFSCLLLPGIKAAEASVGRKLDIKIVFFSSEQSPVTHKPMNWERVDQEALAILIDEEV